MRFSVVKAALALSLTFLLMLAGGILPVVSGQKKTGKKASKKGTTSKKTATRNTGADANSATPMSTPRTSNTATTASTAPRPIEPKRGAGMSNQIGMDFVYVPAGSFMMGSSKGPADEKPVRRVTLREGFYMGRLEVTQAQWQSVMGNNPSHFKGDDRPVEQVSWHDAQDFVRKLNENNDGFTYRLPTEAEWEYAARAGTTEDMPGDLNEMAWYFDNAGGQTHPAGEKQANAFGLHDMHGNVWEWCEDVYHDSYKGAPTDGSAWVKGGESRYRVMRGCSWSDNAFYSRSSERIRVIPETRIRVGGLRVVAVARQQA